MLLKPQETIDAGQVRWVNVINGVEDRHARGKFRPALIVEVCAGHCVTVGFTTHRFTIDGGHERPAVPDHLALGLTEPSYLWSDRPVVVSRLDVGRLVGWAGDTLIELVLTAVTLPTPQRLRLRRYQAALASPRVAPAHCAMLPTTRRSWGPKSGGHLLRRRAAWMGNVARPQSRNLSGTFRTER